MKTFNVYCDESCHLENDKKPYMLIAYMSSAYNQVKHHNTFIKLLKRKHNFYAEIKWSKVSKSKIDFYKSLIDYFFASDLNFRSVIVDKSQIDNKRHGFTFDDFYHRMYYQLLHHKIKPENQYNIFVDYKDTRSYRKIEELKTILNVHSNSIRTLQLIHSHESLLLQLADFIMGAINYYLRGESGVRAKVEIIERINELARKPLNKTTPKYEDKFNLFFIDLKMSVNAS